ncbi:hypothetical protein GJU43_17530 [Flavobacterium sp. LC2016-23]|uniref:hypothetical protein n=1 Tax=Flavobacterium sp. LC2016-23 TaxID=2666330 RepID=UPI0012B11A3B|nr:hypothetical protein [Flavobacterium sp. LC2016-23]MRX41090.1 hypothetical protein [Flavobacterium sp. LC2016-23]
MPKKLALIPNFCNTLYKVNKKEMAQDDHSKIINKVAKEKLGPYGIVQKGKSRLWIDDQGWFIILIEFQPFTRKKGTTLNVGINFNWLNNEYFSFDIGYRQDTGFVEYQTDNQFMKEVELYCDKAIEIILNFRNNLQNNNRKNFILNYTFTSESLWGNYHKGTILGILGETTKMKNHFSAILNEEAQFDWIKNLQSQVKFLIESKDFIVEIRKIINDSRKSKKLPEREINLL